MTQISIPAPVRDFSLGFAVIWPMAFGLHQLQDWTGPLRGVQGWLIASVALATLFWGIGAGMWAAISSALAFSALLAPINGHPPSASTVVLALGASAAIVTAVELAKRKGPGTVAWLPFIQDTPSGRRFWAVRETGDYAADCEAGAAMASELIADICRQKRPELLGWVVANMVEKGKMTGVEVGFMAEIGRSLADHNPDNPAAKAWVVNGHYSGNAGSVHE